MQRRLAVLLLLVCFSAVASARLAHAQTVNQFINDWVNADRNTGGITHIVIRGNGVGALSVHAYGRCHPTDCDWGSKPAAFLGTSLTVVYSPGFVIETLMLTLQNRQLSVSEFDQFIDNSGRGNQMYQYTFDPTSAIPQPSGPPAPGVYCPDGSTPTYYDPNREIDCSGGIASQPSPQSIAAPPVAPYWVVVLIDNGVQLPSVGCSSPPDLEDPEHTDANIWGKYESLTEYWGWDYLDANGATFAGFDANGNAIPYTVVGSANYVFCG